MLSINVHTAIDTDQAYSAAVVEEVLAGGAVEQAGCDGEFLGRPTTRLTFTDHLVLKERLELQYRAGDQARWIDATLRTERELGVHHPAKTWLLLGDLDSPIIANLTPRLQPLDHGLPQMHREPGLELIERLLRLYTRAFVEHDRQLDPGLSNFGTDAAGLLYYLDDESVPARGLASLAAAITSWLRVLPWGDQETGAAIGAALRTQLLELLDDPHALVVVRDQLQSPFAANERQSRAFRALARELVTTRRSRGPGQKARQRQSDQLMLIADIHANLPALEKVLEHHAALKDCELWVLGDIVGYGPEPAACVERVRECERQGAVVIKGNHDHAAALGRSPTTGFSPIARQVLEWTQEQLSADQREWLMDLPAFHRQGEWYAVHGAPQDANYFTAYVYAMTYVDNLDVLKARNIRFCVHGHSHLIGAYARSGHVDQHRVEAELDLTRADHWLICPGSVGQPRSGQPGCEFALIDRRRGHLAFHRVAYDIEATVAAIDDAGLPPQLGDRLRRGR